MLIKVAWHVLYVLVGNRQGMQDMEGVCLGLRIQCLKMETRVHMCVNVKLR